MMFWTWWQVFLAVLAYAAADSGPESPCPSFFQYETKPETVSEGSKGQWNGTLTLLSDYDLSGVWVRLFLDLPSLVLKVHDSFGDVVINEDHLGYVIKNKNHVLKAGVPTKVGITVRYEGDKAPKLTGYRLSGYRLDTKAVCSKKDRNPKPNSSCPRLFEREPRPEDSADQKQKGQWDGTLTLLSDYELYGVWIRLIFDQPSTELQVHDSFGEVITEDHKNYLIKNRNYILKANLPTNVNVTLKYEGDRAPRLIEYRLNAKVVCPEKNSNVDWVENTNGASTSYFLGDLNNKEFLPQVTTFPLVPECGTVPLSAENLSGKIQKTVEGQWPWQASIFLKNEHSESYVCGATLVSAKELLTAAHCVTRKNSEKPVEADLLVVHLGRSFLKVNSTNQQVVLVESIIPHPGYNSRNLRNDIALIKLKQAVIVNDYVRPVCLSEQIGEDVIRREGFVVGFGFDEQKRYTNRLNLAKFQIKDDKDCWEKHPQLETLLNDKTLCATFTNENSICVGDSGNGLVLTKGGLNPVWELKGIVTYGVALQNKYLCDSSSSILMVDVSKYLKWIYNNIS